VSHKHDSQEQLDLDARSFPPRRNAFRHLDARAGNIPTETVPGLKKKKASIQGSGSTLLRFSTVPMPSWPKLSLLRGAHARQLAVSVLPRIN
jgi:hypothetical protein